MKATRYVACAAALILLFATGCGRSDEGDPQVGRTPQDEPVSPVLAPGAETAGAAPAQTKCPVMGGPVNEAIYVDHEGRRVYFCCEGCVDVFLKESGKYLAKLDAQAGETE